MTTFKHSKQLVQLRRIDQPAAARAELLYKKGMWSMAGKVIVEALKAALARANRPQQDQVWQTVNEMIQSGNVPLEGKSKPVTTGISLVHRRDGYLALRQGIKMSRPIGRFGRDFDNANSSYVGQWKLTGEAQKNFKAWAGKER